MTDQEIEDLGRLVERGCGDHSCLLVSPKGMATNGGCRCFGRISGLKKVRMAVEQIRLLLAEVYSLRSLLKKGRLLCASEDPNTGLVCEFKHGHKCELHCSGEFAW